MRRLTQAAITIQSSYRSLAAKRQLRTARTAATKIQAAWRGVLMRRQVQEVTLPSHSVQELLG